MIHGPGASFPELSVPPPTVSGMEITSEQLMATGVMASCPDCGDEGLFVPVDAGCVDGGVLDGCEFCCTRCDAAVFLLEVLDNSGAQDGRSRLAPAV